MRLLVARLLVALHRRNLLLGPFARFRIHVRTDLLQGVPTPPCPRAPTCACPWAQMTIYPTSCPLCSWKGGWQTLNSAGFAARRSGMQLCRTITPRSSSLAGIDIVAAALLIFGCWAAPLDPAGARGTAVAVVRAACGIKAHRPPAPLPPCHRRHGCCHQGPPGGLRCRRLRGLRSIRCRRLRALRCRCLRALSCLRAPAAAARLRRCHQGLQRRHPIGCLHQARRGWGCHECLRANMRARSGSCSMPRRRRSNARAWHLLREPSGCVSSRPCTSKPQLGVPTLQRHRLTTCRWWNYCRRPLLKRPRAHLTIVFMGRVFPLRGKARRREIEDDDIKRAMDYARWDREAGT